MRTLYSTLPTPATPYPKNIELENQQNPKRRKCGGQNQLWLAHTGKELCPEAGIRTKPQWSLCWVSLEGQRQGWALQGGREEEGKEEEEAEGVEGERGFNLQRGFAPKVYF